MAKWQAKAEWLLPNFKGRLRKSSFPREAVQQQVHVRRGCSDMVQREEAKMWITLPRGWKDGKTPKTALQPYRDVCVSFLLSYPDYYFYFFPKGIYMPACKKARILIKNKWNFIYEFRSCNTKSAQISEVLKPWKSCKTALCTFHVVNNEQDQLPLAFVYTP